MTHESTMLVYAIVLGIVHIVLASHSASLQRGYRWTASARDVQLEPLTGVPARFARALANFIETFAFFAAAVLLAEALGKHTPLTRWGVDLYFYGRLAFLALYAFGVPLARSIAWNVALAGIVLLLVEALRA
jgi:uncharacterized MAPEG superfamily protein